MRKSNNSSKSSIAIRRGIKQAARWVARMFGYKAENKFARVVWYVFATCSALVAVYVTVALSIVFFDEVDDMVRDYRYHRKDHD